MGLLDKELIIEKSEYIRKPEWALCKFCKVPFLTSTFSDTCERCSHFVQYKIEYNSKVMLFFIFICILANISILASVFILFKITKNYGLILLVSSILNIIEGSILWNIVKKIMNK